MPVSCAEVPASAATTRPTSRRIVRTRHRFGYWFIGDVSEKEASLKSGGSNAKPLLVWESRQMALPEGDTIVGRGPDSSVWIDARGISRQHARFVIHQGEATVEDLKSKNGTYVGPHRVTIPRRLIDGDQIRLGSVVVVITFRIPQPPGPTETAS